MNCSLKGGRGEERGVEQGNLKGGLGVESRNLKVGGCNLYRKKDV